MTRYFFVLILFILGCCFSCIQSHTNQPPHIANGGRVYGGTIRFVLPEHVRLLPCASRNLNSKRINTQIFEPLLKLDYSTLKVIPSLAVSYKINGKANELILKVRPGVFFHEDNCFKGLSRELHADDVKFTLEMACSGLAINQSSHLLVDLIRGADNFYLHSQKSLPSKGIKGIQIVDSLTLKITLNRRYVGFEKLLTHPNLGILSKKAFELYGLSIINHPIGTGPFKLDQLTEKGVELVRNQSYWRKDTLGNQLPFVSKINAVYDTDKQREILAFRKNKIDFVFNIPVKEIDHVLGSFADAKAGKNIRHRVLSTKSLRLSYLAFNCEKAPFNNPLVRRAFAYAIDKNELIDTRLSGEGWPATFNDNRSIDSLHHEKKEVNPKQAQLLLKKAGYTTKKEFPELKCYVAADNGSFQYTMCLGIAEQLKKQLNITMNVVLCNKKTLELLINQGIASIWMAGWMADYPTKDDFLTLFYAGNTLQHRIKNGCNYQNSHFDRLYPLITQESHEGIRKLYYEQCFQLLSNDVPVIPILYDDFIVMVNARIRNFKINQMENIDFSSIFIHESHR